MSGGAPELPAAGDPFVKVWSLRADGRIPAMAGIHHRVVGQREEPLADARDDALEAHRIALRIAWPAGEQCIGSEEVRADQEARRTRRMPRRVNGLERQRTKIE